MTLSARLHCPLCRGRLAVASATELRCSSCAHSILIVDGIADFAGAASTDGDRVSGLVREHGFPAADLPARIRLTAGDRWPDALGDVIEFGCGLGDMTQAVAAEGNIRSLLVLDSDRSRLDACQERLRLADVVDNLGPEVFFATVAGTAGIMVRDAVADTVIGTTVLGTAPDIRSFLTTVHRILKPGGRAMFVVANRRYWQAVCLALAEALAQRSDKAWPEEAWPLMTKLASKRRRIVNPDTAEAPGDLEEAHLFDADAIAQLGNEAGFATADIIPLYPDTAGADTIGRLCRDAGTPNEFARDAACLAAVLGRRFFGLLTDRDASAFSLVWLAKAPGPAVRLQRSRGEWNRALVYPEPELALGGVSPRWSIELLGRETPDGIVLRVGGWCLSNADVLAVRITLEDVKRDAPAWRYRPDVHEVMNQQRLFHPINALFSGLGSELTFAVSRSNDCGPRLQIEIVLSGGIVVCGPAPDRLIMDEQMVIGH